MNFLTSLLTAHTSAETTLADDLREMERVDRWVCVLVLLSLMPVAVALGIWWSA